MGSVLNFMPFVSHLLDIKQGHLIPFYITSHSNMVSATRVFVPTHGRWSRTLIWGGTGGLAQFIRNIWFSSNISFLVSLYLFRTLCPCHTTNLLSCSQFTVYIVYSLSSVNSTWIVSLRNNYLHRTACTLDVYILISPLDCKLLGWNTVK
jgi:hypothetical protein